MPPNDAKAATVADYLKALLTELWEYGEGFSAKRPFGNSGWQDDLYVAVVSGGGARGVIHEDGYVEDPGEAHDAVYRAIQALA